VVELVWYETKLTLPPVVRRTRANDWCIIQHAVSWPARKNWAIRLTKRVPRPRPASQRHIDCRYLEPLHAFLCLGTIRSQNTTNTITVFVVFAAITLLLYSSSSSSLSAMTKVRVCSRANAMTLSPRALSTAGAPFCKTHHSQHFCSLRYRYLISQALVSISTPSVRAGLDSDLPIRKENQQVVVRL
jgi:hypothetical protein